PILSSIWATCTCAKVDPMVPVFRGSYARGALTSPISEDHAIAFIGDEIFYAVLLIKSIDQLLWSKCHPQKTSVIVVGVEAFVSFEVSARILLRLYSQWLL